MKYTPAIAEEAQKRKTSGARSWRADGTYIRVKGKWVYLYRAVDQDGQTLYSMLSETRDHGAETDFFWRTLDSHGVPDRIVIDKSGANKAGLNTVNDFL